MVVEGVLIDMIKDQTTLNTQILETLRRIDKNTEETSSKLKDSNYKLDHIDERYKHFKEMMLLIEGTMVAIFFALVFV